MLLKSDTVMEGSTLVDQFDSPFVDEVFVRAGDGRICQGPVITVASQGYRLPFETSRSVFAMGAKIATYWAHGYGPVGAGFLDRYGLHRRSEGGFHAALDQLSQTAGADLLVWPYFPMQAREYEWLISWLDIQGGASHPILQARVHNRAFLNCCAESDDASLLREGLSISKNKRKTMGRQIRRLGDLGQVDYVSTRSGYDQGKALEAFFVTEASGWKAHKGTALAVNSNLKQFVEGFLPQMLTEGTAQIDLMMLDERCIGSLISFRAGRGLFTWKTGMDEVYKRSSPGVHLLLEVSKQMIADPDVDYIDSLADTGHPVAESLWDGRRDFAQLFIPLSRVGVIACCSLRAGYEGKAKARYWAKRALGRV
ncbi:GNAT family N-acetyltransferase [Cohaesibacter celericrescens]|nr:GNAT family N-acetyltransferase [Cohaesibacter celericrescens]